MNISIFASIGCQNLWDELILKNEIFLLRKRYGESTKFRVFTYDRENPFFQDKNISYIEYFPIASKNPKNILRNIRNYTNFVTSIFWSNLVVIGWWGIFYENEIQSTRNPLDAWVFRTKHMRFLRKKILFFAVGIDVESQLGLEKLKKIFSYKKAEVTVRDTESFFTLQKLGIESEIVDDPVFSENLDSLDKGKILWALDCKNFSIKDIEKLYFKDKTVGIALRKWYIGKFKNEKMEVLMIEEILSTIEKRGGNIVFLPHSFHSSDTGANDYVFLEQFLKPERTIKNSLREVYESYKYSEIDICLAMRLHSIILSYVYGIDTIMLSYSKKTEQTLKKLSS